MAPEFNEGIAYLMALKQSTGSRPANTTEHTPDTNPQAPSSSSLAAPPAASHERFKGAEKRRTPRYKCEGSAEMREVEHDVKTWATFTDISLNGCYVEAQATYPAGSILHMKLDAQGIRLEAKGCVRVSYPYLGMGIAFVEMSDANRMHLRDLLAKISPPSVIMGPGIASTIPSSGPPNAVPTLSDPTAAIQALVEFFQDRQMLMREDFFRILTKSQPDETKH
jgi:hypothetical protein